MESRSKGLELLFLMNSGKEYIRLGNNSLQHVAATMVAEESGLLVDRSDSQITFRMTLEKYAQPFWAISLGF